MKIRYLGLAILAITLVFASCEKEKEKINKKSMSQLQTEAGIPVSTRILNADTFQYLLTFNANVSGVSESIVTAKISDYVEDVLFSVGDTVQKDDVIIKFPKNNLSANYYQIKTAYENATATFKRMAALYEAKGISRQDYDNIKTQYEVATANWKNVNECINVPAPISGKITRISVRKTENVSSDDVLFAISDLSKLKCQVWIQEKDISKVNVGNGALAIWEGKTIEGRIVQLDLALNSDMQAFGAWVEFDNIDNVIPSGVNARIQLVPYENKNAIVLQRKEIIYSEDTPYVFVVSGDKAVKKAIETGLNYKNDVEVVSGLSFGDILISKGNKSVEDGSFVKVINQE